jgi:hypothetical protein
MTLGSPLVSPGFAGRHRRVYPGHRTGGLAPSSVKPFWADGEAFRKQRRPSIPPIKQGGSIMATFLNAIYRQVCREYLTAMRSHRWA